jgi:hypothetical protein
MKALISILIITFMLPGLLTAGEIDNDYRKQVMALLETSRISDGLDEETRETIITNLHDQKISSRAISFFVRNLPDDFNADDPADQQALIISACRELDMVMKQGMQMQKVQIFFRQYMNSAKKDSQKQKNLLHSSGKKNGEKYKAQYRNRQIIQYRKGRQETGGSGQTENGGNGPPGDALLPGQNNGHGGPHQNGGN